MAFEKKDGQGALFKNQRKEKDTHPDYRGDVMLNGQEYEIGAWLKPTRDGGKFLSLNVKPKQDRPSPQQTSRNEPPKPADDAPFQDDDIPF